MKITHEMLALIRDYAAAHGQTVEQLVKETLLAAMAQSKDPYLDPTGVRLTPSYHGQECQGNGEHPGIECCCDACAFFLECFPEYDDLPKAKQ